MATPPSESIDRAWRGACKVIFGQEVGGISEFEAFLKRYSRPLFGAKSHKSGKGVFYSAPYCKRAKFLDFGEVDFSKKPEPLPINAIKDIDSLLAAASERAEYAGSKVIGNSKFTEMSENCIDCVNVFSCSEVTKGENLAYSNFVIDCKYLFGCSAAGYTAFGINTCEYADAPRCFESALAFHSSDIYYSYYCRNCQDVFFSFNMRSKRNAIGNLELSRDEYLEIKSSLLFQMADEMKSKKSLPPLLELVGGKNAGS